MYVSRVQDPVHGLMEFRDMEASVVDIANAREIQRLRRIRQLGLTYLVFPGADHSRFSHSLGAAHLGVRFARQVARASRALFGKSLQPRAEDIRNVALAGLCHDLGHGPLSHMWEREVIDEEFDRAAWIEAFGLAADPRLNGLKWHELATQALLVWPEGDLHKRLERYEEGTADRIARFLTGEYTLPFLPPLLNGDIDVDRCDFVARDALHSGVAYGRYDIDWLISMVTIGFDGSREPVVGFDKRKARRVIEQFLIARRALYDTVYQHKTVRGAEGMFGLFLKRLKGLARSGDLPSFPNRGLARPLLALFERGTFGPEELLALDDNSLWILAEGVASQRRCDAILRGLAERLLNRDLFKCVAAKPDAFEFLNRPEASRREGFEAVIAKATGNSDPRFSYYLDKPKLSLLADGEDVPDRYGSATFINTDIPSRKASLVRNARPPLMVDSREPVPNRLFVPREALEPVEKFLAD